MPKLVHIESGAMQRLGRMPEGRWRARQQTLVTRCDAHGPVSARQVGAMLGEIRHAWLG